jgi:hypothetical protein
MKAHKHIKLVTIILLVSIVTSCESEQSKFIKAEFSKIQARWLVDSFVLSGSVVPVADSLMKKFKTGEILFKQCKYDEKEFAKGGRGCGGDFDINGFIYGVSYMYDYSSGRYTMFLSIPVGNDNKPLSQGYDRTVIDLIYGEWTIEATDTKLLAKQTKNYNNPNILISFTATKK